MEPTFVTTSLILKAYKREGYEVFNIVGKKGSGKTVFSIKVMAQIFMSFGYSEEEAYQIAVDHLLFDKKEIISFLLKHSNHQQPVLCWDDIRVHASGMSYVTAPLATQKLLGLLDTARDSICGFLTTSPSMKGVLGFIRKEEGYSIKIKKMPSGNRKAVGYSRYELPSGQMRIATRYNDIYKYKLPDDIYRQIKEKRRLYKQIVLRNLDRAERKTDSDIQAKRIQKEIEVVQSV